VFHWYKEHSEQPSFSLYWLCCWWSLCKVWYNSGWCDHKEVDQPDSGLIGAVDRIKEAMRGFNIEYKKDWDDKMGKFLYFYLFGTIEACFPRTLNQKRFQLIEENDLLDQSSALISLWSISSNENILCFEVVSSQPLNDPKIRLSILYHDAHELISSYHLVKESIFCKRWFSSHVTADKSTWESTHKGVFWKKYIVTDSSRMRSLSNLFVRRVVVALA